MISLPLLFSIFLGYSFFFRRLFKVEFSHALIFFTSIILSIYFIASILYILDPIIYASFALGIGLFLYSLFDFLKQNNIKNISDLFGVDVIIFITAMTIYFICVKNYPSYYFWDEYSHWGLFLKEINIYHGFRLPENESAVLAHFNTYVKLVAVFQYSISKILGFKESFNIFANGFLCLIFCSVVFVEKKPFLSIVSLKYTINKLENVSNFSDVGPPIERQNRLKDLIQSGIKDGSEFKEHNFKLLDCYIYNYLEAPNTDKNIFAKCLAERRGIF